jgi:hypothetical protein
VDAPSLSMKLGRRPRAAAVVVVVAGPAAGVAAVVALEAAGVVAIAVVAVAIVIAEDVVRAGRSFSLQYLSRDVACCVSTLPS